MIDVTLQAKPTEAVLSSRKRGPSADGHLGNHLERASVVLTFRALIVGARRRVGVSRLRILTLSASNIGSDSHLMIFLPSLRFSNGGINAMRAGIRISSLVPSGLVIESVSDSSDSIILAVRFEAGMAECPLCGSRSRRLAHYKLAINADATLMIMGARMPLFIAPASGERAATRESGTIRPPPNWRIRRK